MEAGHKYASFYPLCVLHEEASIVRRRANQIIKTNATLNVLAMIAKYDQDALDEYFEALGKLEKL